MKGLGLKGLMEREGRWEGGLEGEEGEHVDRAPGREGGGHLTAGG